MLNCRYPMGGSAPWGDILQAYINATSPRTVGWMSFYWGTAKQLDMSPIGAAMYDDWLGIFGKGRPW